MQRQFLTINAFNYLCELYDGTEEAIQTYKKFVMIRNVEINANTTLDKHIFFIPKNVFDEIVKDKSTDTDKYVFTITNNNNVSNQYSRNYNDYNDLLTIDTFDYSNYDDSPGIASILTDKNGTEVPCLCDKLRIYHPFNKSDLNYIIHIDNYINDIHFHYLCDLNTNYVSKANTEIVLNNEIYSEYIEVTFPNLTYLFEMNTVNKDEPIENYNVYFEDMYNNIRYEHNGEISESIKNVPLAFLLHPSYMNYNEVDLIGDKIVTDLTIDNYINYMSFPINIIIYPYSHVDNSLYLSDPTYEYDVNTFLYNKRFTLTSNIEFMNGELAIVNKFNYPGKDKGLKLQEAYAKYNGLTITYDPIQKRYNCENYKNIEERLKNLEDDENEGIYCCGYKFEIANDYFFKNVVFTDYQEMHFIDDFAFYLTNLIKTWESLPNTLLIRITYIDKYLGMSLSSNFNVLPKEYIKYIINNDECNTTRINIKNNQSVMGWNIINTKPDEGTTYFNFLNNVNFVVTKNIETPQSIDNIKTPQILYKPIFYRTNELSSVYIKKGLQQKIGINLANYMSKVTKFKIIIDNNEYTEYARNDVFVIFDIFAGDITVSNGVYNVVNADNNYITSGKYILVE